jgi:hypothetical protein
MKLENNIKNASLLYVQNEKIEKKSTEKTEDNTKSKRAVKTDKLELSVEALKLQPIKAKIAQGFYDNPDVLKDVVSKLYSEVFDKEE